ncbi:MAG: M3 family oligoendopeptidase [Methanobacteriota archaeon]
MDLKKKYPRKFLKKGENMGNPKAIRAAYSRLDKMPMGDKMETARFCEAWGEAVSGIFEVFARSYWAVTTDTRDKKAEKEYSRLAEEVIPLQEELDDKVKRRLLKAKKEWVPKDLAVFRTKAEWAVKLYREENLPRVGENIKLANEYQRLVSEWQTEFDGKRRTASQLRPYLEKPDRKLREKAWRARMKMQADDCAKLDALFDRMLVVRNQMAKAAGLPDYVEYQYRRYSRLSYDRKDAEKFRAAIHKYVVPAASMIFERRRKMLRLPTIRPWDLAANPDGADPPKVYRDIPDLKAKAVKVLGAVDPEFAEAFTLLDKKGYLDLENRPGKAPGAYCNDYAEERMTVIFCNSVGTSGDFDTLMHEGGHAIHGLMCRDKNAMARDVPLEFAELASMAMEKLSRPHWNMVYNKKDEVRIKRQQLETAMTFLPFMAMLDEFQAWVYSDPKGARAAERSKFWAGLEKKYRPHIDWSGLEQEEGMGWQYNHVYTVPLYYIEYGIAQVGALQVFLRSKRDYEKAVKDYKKGLSLGCTVGLPELYKAAGIKLVMKEPDILGKVVGGIMGEVGLARYPGGL